MKRMKYWIALCAALLIVFSARPLIAATDITGTWVGDLSTPDGNTFPLKFNFKQDGSKLTGTVEGPQGDPLAINDGKIDGDKITFTVTFNDTVIHHEGTIDGDQIKVSSKSDNDQMPPMQFTLKRSTDAAK
ncbi:MAG TPA: hypothetical protein VKT75_00745 [Acidobacteriaceae bacterium]|nr:hypothetical protein [Acidobacteriaceae bacterium]